MLIKNYSLLKTSGKRTENHKQVLSVFLKSILNEFKKNKSLFFMILPAVIFFVIFAYLPMAGLILAFKNYNYSQGIFFSPWVGLENFSYFFKSGIAWQVTRNTIVFNFLFMATGIIASVSVAIFLTEIKNRLFKKITQSFTLFPFFVSWVVVAAFMYNIFSYDYGIFNTILKSLGFEPISIYEKAFYWYILLPLLNIWKFTGYSSAIFLASISGINIEYYEAATVDGANTYQKIWKITLPLLRPTIVILVLLSIGSIARGNLDMFYQMIGNNGMLYNSTDVIDTYVFRALATGSAISFDFGLIASAAFYQSVLCFIIISTVNHIIKKLESDYALF